MDRAQVLATAGRPRERHLGDPSGVNIQFVHAPGRIQEDEDVMVFGLHVAVVF